MREAEERAARAAWQGPAHAWMPWAAAGLAGAGAFGLGHGAGTAALAAATTGAAGLAAFLAWREPPPRRARTGAWLSVVGALAATPLGSGFHGVEEPGRAGLVALLLAVGAAHPAIVGRTRAGAAGSGWGTFGIAIAAGAAAAVALAQTYPVVWLAAAAGVVPLELGWLRLLVRARREEREPGLLRFACPRCGVVQSRSPGRGPCEACGLFVLAAGGMESAQSTGGAPPGAGSLWMLCPRCRLRLGAPFGASRCPQCRASLRAEWNVHATGALPPESTRSTVP